MQSELAHHGGSVFSSASGLKTFGLNPRCVNVAINSGTGHIVRFTHDYSSRPEYLLKAGREQHVVINTGTASQAVQDRQSNVLGTLATNEWMKLHLLGIDGSNHERWYVQTGKLGIHGSAVGFTVGRNRSEPITNPASQVTMNPYCFDGSDCAFMRVSGQAALDGTGGNATVVVPFYQDVTVHARNQDREAIRAADLVMPKLVPVRFTDGAFTQDTTHPLYATYGALSNEFWDTLHNRATNGPIGAKPLVLTYNAGLSGQSRTRHWHHLEYDYPDFIHGTGAADLLAWKYVWNVSIPYGPAEAPTQYTLEIRLIAEHTLSSAVPISGSPSGPKFQGFGTTYGAWGTIFTLAVFTNEVAPAFTDNSTTFQAAGDGSARTYTRLDPAVSGQAYNVGTDETKKFVHPQCVIMAHLPTTYEAPCGRNAVPIVNELEYDDGLARNLARCYDVPNGCPYLSGSCTDTFPRDPTATPTYDRGIVGNCVFGLEDGFGSVGKAMSLGGNMDRSKPMEWLCFENKSGSGRTYLKPSVSGWSESCGKLDIGGGTAGSIAICVEDDSLPIDQSEGIAVPWPKVPGISSCDGHPAEPFDDIGGSHTCFRNRDQAQGYTRDHSNTTCCTPIADAGFSYRLPCSTAVTIYDHDTNESLDTDVLAKDYGESLVMHLSNYTFDFGGDGTNRVMTWARLKVDNSKPDRSLTYAGSSTGWTANAGSTFTHNPSSLVVASSGGGTFIKALNIFDPGTLGWFGTDMSCRLNQVTTVKMGLGLMNGSSYGYAGVVSKSGSDLLVEIVKFTVSATRVVLASNTIVGQGSNATGVARFRIHGTDILFEYTPTGQAKVAISAEDGQMYQTVAAPGLSQPWNDSVSYLAPAILTETAGTGATFDQFATPFIQDIVRSFSAAEGYIAYGGTACSIPIAATPGYAACTENTDTSGDTVMGTYEVRIGSMDDAWLGTGWDIPEGLGGPYDIYSGELFTGCRGKPNLSLGNIGVSSLGSTQINNPTYHGGPMPYVYYCGGACAGTPPCSDGNYLGAQAARMTSWALPVSGSCWKRPADPKCIGSIPLLCYGTDSYFVDSFACL